MSTPVAYRLRIRLPDDSGDALVVTSIRGGTNPYIAKDGVHGEGQTLDPLTGQTTIGAYTVQVIDEVGTITVGGNGWLDDPQVDPTGNPTGGFDAEWPLVRQIDGADSAGPGTLAVADGLLRMSVLQNFGIGLFGTAVMTRTRTFTGFVPGATYTIQAVVTVAGGITPGNQVSLVVNSVGASSSGGNSVLSVSAVANGSGHLAVTMGVIGSGLGQPPMVATFGYPRFIGPTAGGGGGDPIDDSTVLTGRIVTSSLTDTQGRQQLLSRKAFVEESVDNGGAWTNLTAGYINRYAMVDAIRWEFTVGESRRVEQSLELFKRTTDPTEFPSLIGKMDRACCLVGGPIVGDFGPIQDRGRPLYRVSAVNGTKVMLEWVTGALNGVYGEFGPPVRGNVLDFINRAALDYLPDPSFPTIVTGFNFTPLAGVVARLYNAGSGARIGEQAVLAFVKSTGKGSTSPAFTNSDGVFWVDWTGTLPSVGATYKVAVFPTTISERNPLHVSGHPMDILGWWLTITNQPFDETSRLAVKAALGSTVVVHYRITKSMTAQDATEQYIYAPFGVAPRLTDAGELEFFLCRDATAVSVGFLSIDDLSSDKGTAFSTEESKAANKLTFKSQSFAETAERTDSAALDAIRMAPITTIVTPEDATGRAVFGDREVTWEIPGLIEGLIPGTTENPGTLDLWVASQAQPLFDWQGRGSVEGEFHVLRGRTPAKVGDIFEHRFAHVPTASPTQSPSSQRGTVTRRAIVLRRTVVPEGLTLLMQDRGPSADQAPPVYDVPGIVCGVIDPVTALTAVVLGTSVTLTWVVGSDTVPVAVLYRLTADTDNTSLLTLPAGSTTVTVTLPDASTNYTLVVRHLEPPPRNCVSADTEIAITTDAVQVLSPPIDPAAWGNGAGTYGMECTATEFPSGTEVWEAVETVAGSFTAGTYALGGSVVSVSGGRTRYTSPTPAPNDGLLRFLKARHTRTGWTPSAYTAAVFVNPWLTTSPVPPPPPGPPVLGAPLGGVFDADMLAGFDQRARWAPGAAAETMGPESYWVVPAERYGAARIIADVTEALPSGAVAGAQYVPADNTSPVDGDWLFLNATNDGPTVGVDAVTSVPRRGFVVELAPAAQQDITIRGVTIGGDGSTVLGLRKLQVQFLPASPIDPEAQDPPADPPTDPCNIGGFTVADLVFNPADPNDLSSLTALGFALTATAPAFASTRIGLLDPLNPTIPVIRIEIQVSGAAIIFAGAYTWLANYAGPFSSSNTYYVQAEFRREVVTNRVGSLSGYILEGMLNVHSWFSENESGYATSTGATIAGNNADKDLSFGYYFVDQGNQNHHEIVYIKSVRLIEVGCVGDGGGPNPGGGGGGNPTPPPPPTVPPPPPSATGLRALGLWNYLQRYWFDYNPFNAVLVTPSAYTPTAMTDLLDAVRDAGMAIVLNLVYRRDAKVGGSLGTFSQNLWLAKVNGYTGVDISSYTDVVTGIVVIDEPGLSTATGWGTVIPQSVCDGVLAKRASELFPGFPLFERVSAVKLEQQAGGRAYQYITGCWNQYPGLRSGQALDQFMAANKAAQVRLGLPFRMWGTITDGNAGATQTTAAQLRAWGVPMAADPESSGFYVWADSNPPAAFLQNADYQKSLYAIKAAGNL